MKRKGEAVKRCPFCGGGVLESDAQYVDHDRECIFFLLYSSLTRIDTEELEEAWNRRRPDAR